MHKHSLGVVVGAGVTGTGVLPSGAARMIIRTCVGLQVCCLACAVPKRTGCACANAYSPGVAAVDSEGATVRDAATHSRCRG